VPVLVDGDQEPAIRRIWETWLALPAFDCALPTNQPDFVSPTGH
jgi:hypothetical protein